MSVQEFDARIQHKNDSQANWEANNPVLLENELIFVEMTDGGTRMKLGDGVSAYNALDFIDKEGGGGAVSKNITLTAAGWSGGQQTVAVDGVTADSNGLASLPQNFTGVQYEAVVAAEMFVSGQAAGEITFSANGEVPQIDIPVVVILFG